MDTGSAFTLREMNTTNQREKETMDVLCRARNCSVCTVRWIDRALEPRKIVDRIEACVIVAAVFMIVLGILAPRRRQIRSSIMRYALQGAFVLSVPLLPYAAGLIQGQLVLNALYPVWATFLLMLFEGTNSMSSQKISDTKKFLKQLRDLCLFGFYLVTIVASYSWAGWVGNKLPANICYIAVSILFALKSAEKIESAILVSKPSPKNGITVLANYMKREHQESTTWDAHTMQGYRYMVLIHKEEPGVPPYLRLDFVFSALSHSDSPPICRLKDLCLSFALFHLVVRRYFGYTCHESKHVKTRDLVLHGLLRTEQDYERAFQVIEAELAFVHDFFFTKYAYIMYHRLVWSCGLSLASAILPIAMCAWALGVNNTEISKDYDQNILVLKMIKRDVMITWIVLGVLSVFQLMQIWSYCASDWAKVSLVCKYAYGSGCGLADICIEKLLWFVGRPHRGLRYWRNTMGQFTVLHLHRSGYWDRLKGHLYEKRKTGKHVGLSLEVKKAVAGAIKISINGHLSNGASALTRHGMSDELGWACKIDEEFTLTHSILVWHVATSYCEISETVAKSDGNYVYPNKGVATTLSKYCAYLVAFIPTLLPGSPMESQRTLENLELDAGLMRMPTPEIQLSVLDNLADADFSERLLFEQTPSDLMLTKSVSLGKALQSMPHRTVQWDLLSDFWAEMMVYIAPSDNIEAHIDHLSKCGEFVTHVWALLMHAGILERPAPAATEGP